MNAELSDDHTLIITRNMKHFNKKYIWVIFQVISGTKLVIKLITVI